MGTGPTVKRSFDDAADRQVTAVVGDISRAHAAERRTCSGMYDEPPNHSADNRDASGFDNKSSGDHPAEGEPSSTHHTDVALDRAGFDSLI